MNSTDKNINDIIITNSTRRSILKENRTMTNSWFFPSNNYGTVSGIGEASIETFRGSPYRSLAREICQNSMDARVERDKPVIVEFSNFTISNKDIPDFNTLRDSIISCLNFWTEQNNRKTIDFFKKAKTVVESSIISVLRISDFNTTGLQGSNKEFNTPWHNLVKSDGVSGKEGSAGGSYGIGKAAPFACSDLRTLFYATKDIDGLKATQGIAKLVSFREKGIFKDKDSITSGTGYYSLDKKNNPLRECCSIDPKYKRNECGTDIFILGFNKCTDWKLEIITSILEEFLIAIFNNELIVNIDGTEISARNLGEIIEAYKDTAKLAYNYYQVLTDKESSVIQHEFPGLGTIELHILIKQALHRKVMMCRKNGMKIFDKANISSTIQFAGICMLKDESINEYFRGMENPQHNAWEPERQTTDSKNKAKSNMAMLYKFVKEAVIDLGKKTTVDEIDAEGMGEFFADTELIDTNNQSKDEAISSITSNIELNVTTPQRDQIGYEDTLDGNTQYSKVQDEEYLDEDYGGTGSKDKHDDDKNNTQIGTGFGDGNGDNPGTHGLGKNSFLTDLSNSDDISSATHIGTMNVRLFLSDRSKNIYTLVFVPQKNAGNGYLQIDLSGEQKNVKASIVTANDIKNNLPLVCKGNRISLNNIERNSKNKISFQIDYAEECSMEVKLYGYSS